VMARVLDAGAGRRWPCTWQTTARVHPSISVLVRRGRPEHGMSLNDNKRLIERLYADGINRQDAAAAAAFYAANARNHGRTVGRAGMQDVFEALFAAFPDLNYRIVESTAEGDRVVCQVIMTATHRGKPTMPHVFGGMLAGAAPTGKRVEV